jgi:dolichyl-phosphate beta-glucosyltransferase
VARSRPRKPPWNYRRIIFNPCKKTASVSQQKITLVLVVPCYNEAHRLQLELFLDFLKTHPHCAFIFVDDGSTDNTSQVLATLAASNPEAIQVVTQKKNQGKAESVRIGTLKALEWKPEKVGFLDADLSITPEECYRLSTYVEKQTSFVFGSRIKLLDNRIERKWYRFLIGRLIATLISKMLNLPVYDTQCGGKVFAASLGPTLFDKPFISRWLFDVELFFRALNLYGKAGFTEKSKEVPVRQWVDTTDSKVPLSYGFWLWLDLIKIYNAYH